ncbi:MAG TPA: TetR/AcrR family transcriptional regulator C-terminal domain-containing protein [Candidatus Limnocylindria bacterium]|nr:TetR/AcrR family transcriptional regulator C-terminal domain-containing protein [Candidatus Limnocylindria bacterium]
MTTPARESLGRTPLNREAVLDAAIALADAEGIGALTMRRLAGELGVEAMTLYYHVANKDEILSGIVDRVIGEFELPDPNAPWRAALRRTAVSAHDVLLRHRWAASLMLSPGTVSDARLRYMEAVLRTLRGAGLSPTMTDRAYHAYEAHISGFTLWQVQMDLDPETLPDLAERFKASLDPTVFPYLIEHIEQHFDERPPDDEGAFAFGLDLLLEGLERILATSLRESGATSGG